ncbi:Hypothetical protein CINCED_3A001893 [Cinara cedri]|uniref:Uncharacterized protein n=1 Tax=Cinara cedri TaxID=506608 RepID=A0A5E4MB43_9HEMI|nr:Hypothetical protein CINCED_3A001893 [Cinara cedri]
MSFLECLESTTEETEMTLGELKKKRCYSEESSENSKKKSKKEETEESILPEVLEMTVPRFVIYCRERLELEIKTEKEEMIQVLTTMNVEEENETKFPMWNLILMFLIINEDFLNGKRTGPLLTKTMMEKVEMEKQMKAIDLTIYPKILRFMNLLRKNLKTVLEKCPLLSLINTSRENIDLSTEYVCLADLMDYYDVCQNCRKVLENIAPYTGISSRVTENTSTLSTYVNGPLKAVDVDGSKKATCSRETSSPVERGLFELPGLTPEHGEEFLTTYLTTRGSSKKLVGSQKMADYVIDLNIYRYVLCNRILYICENTFRDKERHLNYIKPLTFKRPPLVDKYYTAGTPLFQFFDDYCNGDWYKILRMSEFTLRNYRINAGKCFRNLVSTYHEWKKEIQNCYQCDTCTFFHIRYMNTEQFEDFLDIHPHLNETTIDFIYANCVKKLDE